MSMAVRLYWQVPVAGIAVAAAAAVAILSAFRGRRRKSRGKRANGVIFTGTGCSSALPMMKCREKPSGADCKACTPAMRNGALDPNDRLNVGLLIRVEVDGKWRHIQIDVGKTFRQSVLRWYPTHDIPSLDAVVLTHDHADAVLGLDEIRGLQPWDSSGKYAGEPMRCLCDPRTLRSMRRVFSYLFPREPQEKPGAFATNGLAKPERFVAKIDWRAIPVDLSEEAVNFFEPVPGFSMCSLPVMHGEDYIAYGFGFGKPGSRVAYISDFSRILPATMTLLESWRDDCGISLLVLDCLCADRSSPFHPNLPQALEVTRRLRPKKCLLVGMGHSMEHREMNAKLKKEHPEIDIQLARDGLFLPLDLL